MKIFIGASVRKKIDEKYKKEGRMLATYLLEKGDKVIICADEGGIIGEIYRPFMKEKPENVILTVPEVYKKYTKGITKKIDIVTDTINERTDESIQEADICLFLPGGIGTAYEILSTIETKRAGEHNKPIVIVNSYGFYDHLIELLEQMYQEHFADEENKDVYVVVNNMDEGMTVLTNLKK